MRVSTWGLCPTLAPLICMTGLLGESPVSSLRSVVVGRVRKRGFHSSARKTVFHVSSLSDAWFRGLKGGFVNADKTKARFHSGKWRCDAPSQCCEIVTSVQDCDLLPPQRWHEGCWLLTLGS